MIIDIAGADLTPAWLCSEKMLSQAKQQLSGYGVMVMNLLVDDARSFASMLADIRNVFHRRTLCHSIPDHKNIIVFSFKQAAIKTSTAELAGHMKKLTSCWGLEFSVFLEQLKEDNPSDKGVFSFL